MEVVRAGQRRQILTSAKLTNELRWANEGRPEQSLSSSLDIRPETTVLKEGIKKYADLAARLISNT